MSVLMPVLTLIPQKDYKPKEDIYRCPVYKTTVRAGTLTTTG